MKRELLSRVCHYKLQQNIIPWPKIADLDRYLIEVKGMTKKEARNTRPIDYVDEYEKWREQNGENIDGI